MNFANFKFLTFIPNLRLKLTHNIENSRVFFPGGGFPPSGENFANPPIRHLSPFLDQGLSPPAEVRPQKFEKFEYIFVSNLTTSNSVDSNFKFSSYAWFMYVSLP